MRPPACDELRHDQARFDALAEADSVGGGLLPLRSALQVGSSIARIADATGLDRDDVLASFRWYMGKMTEVGCYDPPKFYAELEHQAKGNPPRNRLIVRQDAGARRAPCFVALEGFPEA